MEVIEGTIPAPVAMKPRRSVHFPSTRRIGKRAQRVRMERPFPRQEAAVPRPYFVWEFRSL